MLVCSVWGDPSLKYQFRIRLLEFKIFLYIFLSSPLGLIAAKILTPTIIVRDNSLFRVVFRENNYYRGVKRLKSRFVNDTFFSFWLGGEKYNKAIKRIEK
jgi:hypothetical protein